MISTLKTPILKRRARSFIALTGLSLWTIAACSSSSEERERAAGLAGGCLLNSDCDSKHICTFGRCHVPCDQDRDCDRDLRCVKDAETGAFSCLLDDEMICKEDRHCPKGLVCGVDNECRYTCKSDDDCIDTQVCDDRSDHCASTDPGKDELDADNNLVPAPAAAGGMSGGEQPGGGTGGTGNVGGTDMTVGGHEGEVGGMGGMTPEPMAGAGGDAVSPGAAGYGGGPTYPSADFEEEPGQELVDNNTYQKAVPVTTSANLYLEEQDHDWLSFTAPDDGRAHIITVRVEQEATVTSGINVLASADQTQIGATPNFGEGTLRYVYVTVGPGTKTYFDVYDIGVKTSQGMVFVTFEDTPENDEHEPNNRWEDASEIVVGSTVSGQLLRPYVSESEPPLVEDWFEIELAAGPATFQFLSVPSEGRFNVQLRNPDGTMTSFGTTTAGQAATFPPRTVAAGRHAIRVMPYSVDVKSYASYIKPTYLTEQYSFTVTQ